MVQSKEDKMAGSCGSTFIPYAFLFLVEKNVSIKKICLKKKVEERNDDDEAKNVQEKAEAYESNNPSGDTTSYKHTKGDGGKA